MEMSIYITGILTGLILAFVVALVVFYRYDETPAKTRESRQYWPAPASNPVPCSDCNVVPTETEISIGTMLDCPRCWKTLARCTRTSAIEAWNELNWKGEK